MSKRTTAIHLDRLAQALNRHGVELKRHQLLDVAANAFGYRNNNEFTAAKVSAPQAEPLGTIEIQGSTVVLARDLVSDAIFAVEETFLDQVSLEERAETYLPTPYGHLADVSRLLDESLPNLDKESVISTAIEYAETRDGYVLETIDHDERLYWSNVDGWVNLKSATRFSNTNGNLPICLTEMTWRTVNEAENLRSLTESWVGVKNYELAKKIASEIIAKGDQAKAHFTPQVWIRDYATECDSEGEQEYDVTIDLVAYALRDNVETIEEYLDGTDKDEFQTSDNAPDWVKDWSGPFNIDIDASVEILTIDLHEARKRFSEA